MTEPGPLELGRGVVVAGDRLVPSEWQHAPEVVVDEAELADPASTVTLLHGAWAGRRPVVVRLLVDPARFREPQQMAVEPWTLRPDHELWLDRLHFLVWANTYDARTGPPVWWWAAKAARLGGELGGPADFVLPDGRPAWVDGGPRAPLPAPLSGAVVVHAETVDAGLLEPQRSPVAPHAELAADQLAAVAHGSGPARVIAPAGSGKTRVLTERLRHLVVDRGYERASVLAVAYNVKARDEMVERTRSFGPRIQTLNGLGFAVLREALGTAPRVLDEREVRRLVDGLLPRARQRRANTDPIAPYLEALQETRLGLRAPAEVEVDRGDVPGFAALFAPYRAALKQQGVVDFDDQVYRAIEVLLADGALRRRLQERHRHMLVDEFQDLTPAHVLLVRLLAAPRLDVFGVGDDDQVIYGHAGADPSFLIDFASLFPAAHEHALEVNHRCPAPVVEAAANLLSHNRRRVPKVILSAPTAATGADRLRVVRERPDHLAVAVRDAVLAWRAEGVADADIAVLARVNSLLLAPQVALAEAGVALMPMVETNVLQRLGVRAVLAYLRLATGEKWAKSDLVEVYRRPSRGLPEWIQKWLRDGASANSLRAAAERIDDAKVADKLVSLVDDIQALQALARKGADTRRLMVSIRDDVGLGAAIEQLDRTKGEGSSQLDDVEALLQLADLHPDPASFESWVASALRTPPSGDGVTLATVHKVKGREWPYVVLFGVTAGILPHRLAADDEEERRVLHVAITRASRQVVLVADATRPSSFLPELEQPAPPQIDGSPPAPTVTRGRPQPPPKPGPAIDPGDPVAAALKAWRSQRSRADGVPAYVVFDDKTLAELARVRPESLTELARIKGIGPAKLDRYGEEVIALLASLA